MSHISDKRNLWTIHKCDFQKNTEKSKNIIKVQFDIKIWSNIFISTQIHNEKEKGKKITKIFHSPLHLELTLNPLQKLSKGADETIKIFQNKSSISCSFMWGSWVKMTAWRWQAILININTKYKYKICIAYTVRCVFSAIISLHKVREGFKKNKMV